MHGHRWVQAIALHTATAAVRCVFLSISNLFCYALGGFAQRWCFESVRAWRNFAPALSETNRCVSSGPRAAPLAAVRGKAGYAEGDGQIAQGRRNLRRGGGQQQGLCIIQPPASRLGGARGLEKVPVKLERLPGNHVSHSLVV